MPHVILYSQPSCGPCQSEKAWLAQHDIPFDDRDIYQNASWLNELVGLGSRATPTTVVETGNGRQVIIGFNPEKILEGLGR